MGLGSLRSLPVIEQEDPSLDLRSLVVRRVGSLVVNGVRTVGIREACSPYAVVVDQFVTDRPWLRVARDADR